MIKLKNILTEQKKTDGYHAIFKAFEGNTSDFREHRVSYSQSTHQDRWILTWNFRDNGMVPQDAAENVYAAQLMPKFDDMKSTTSAASKAILVIYLPSARQVKNPAVWNKISKRIAPIEDILDISATGYDDKAYIIDSSNVSKAITIINELGGNAVPMGESYAWQRKEGQPLPTLKDVQEAYDAKGVDEAADGAAEGAKPDYIDADGDGNEKESMKKAFADKESANEGMMCESCECDPCECDDDKDADESVLNMGSLGESFWGRVKGNLHGHEYILREAFKK
jgi:hypothetical protein